MRGKRYTDNKHTYLFTHMDDLWMLASSMCIRRSGTEGGSKIPETVRAVLRRSFLPPAGSRIPHPASRIAHRATPTIPRITRT